MAREEMESADDLSVEPGLCRRCRHARVVTSGKGSRFLLCRRSATDPEFPKYPALPVLACIGFEPSESS